MHGGASKLAIALVAAVSTAHPDGCCRIIL
jgi:hypothetical protein